MMGDCICHKWVTRETENNDISVSDVGNDAIGVNRFLTLDLKDGC